MFRPPIVRIKAPTIATIIGNAPAPSGKGNKKNSVRLKISCIMPTGNMKVRNPDSRVETR